MRLQVHYNWLIFMKPQVHLHLGSTVPWDPKCIITGSVPWDLRCTITGSVPWDPKCAYIDSFSGDSKCTITESVPWTPSVLQLAVPSAPMCAITGSVPWDPKYIITAPVPCNPMKVHRNWQNSLSLRPRACYNWLRSLRPQVCQFTVKPLLLSSQLKGWWTQFASPEPELLWS